MSEPIVVEKDEPSREQVFRTMFWHEKNYGHETETLPDGWRCLGCDAKMTARSAKP